VAFDAAVGDIVLWSLRSSEIETLIRQREKSTGTLQNIVLTYLPYKSLKQTTIAIRYELK
jgi:hypothetical protein